VPASTSTTIWPRGTLRTDAFVFVGAGRFVLGSRCRDTCNLRCRKFTSPTSRPRASEIRSPVPASRTTSAAYRAGVAATVAANSPGVGGATSTDGRDGSLIRTHGDTAILRSSTAAAMSCDSTRCTLWTVFGASRVESAATRPCTSERRSVYSGRSPNAGTMWLSSGLSITRR